MKGVFEHSVGQRVSYTLTLTLTLLTHSPAHCLQIPALFFVVDRCVCAGFGSARRCVRSRSFGRQRLGRRLRAGKCFPVFVEASSVEGLCTVYLYAYVS